MEGPVVELPALNRIDLAAYMCGCFKDVCNLLLTSIYFYDIILFAVGAAALAQACHKTKGA